MSDTCESGSERTRVGHTKMDDTDVYIGRGPDGANLIDTPIGDRGWLGNPFTVEQWDRGPAIEAFRRVFNWRLASDSEFRDAVKELEGKTLGCWCQRTHEDGPGCHGEIIADYLSETSALSDTDTE